eukprot:SM000219S06667  [mRNA]  locus=s219:24877:27675:+ [translate_table: standard]
MRPTAMASRRSYDRLVDADDDGSAGAVGAGSGAGDAGGGAHAHHVAAEKLYLGLSMLGVVATHWLSLALAEVLVDRPVYGPGGQSLAHFPRPLALLGTLLTFAAALAALLFTQPPAYPDGAPASYAGIAAATTAASLSQHELPKLLPGAAGMPLVWEGGVAFCVIVWQLVIMKAQPSRTTWLLGVGFLLGSLLSCLPWAFSDTSPKYLAGRWILLSITAGIGCGVLLVMGAALSQAWQDKLYQKEGMSVCEQVVYISFFLALLQSTEILILDTPSSFLHLIWLHPLSLARALAIATPAVIMAFLMSYMLRLCGALICAMIHQMLMVVTMAWGGNAFGALDRVWQVLGMAVMSAVLAVAMLDQHVTMIQAQGNSHIELEELITPRRGQQGDFL